MNGQQVFLRPSSWALRIPSQNKGTDSMRFVLDADHEIDTAIYDIDTVRSTQLHSAFRHIPDNFEDQSGIWCEAILEQKASVAQKSTATAILTTKNQSNIIVNSQHTRIEHTRVARYT